jgi:putative hydrolase of the HAD superfamily
MVAAISFDVTHTLLGLPRMGEIYAEVLAQHGIECNGVRLQEMVPRVWRQISRDDPDHRDRFLAHPRGPEGFWHQLLATLCQELELEEPPVEAARELYERFGLAESWDIFPEVPAVLSTLSNRGFRMGVVSNFDPRLPGLLQDAGLDRFFEAIVYSSDVGVEKPHPDIFRTLLRQMRLPSQAVLHVGDSRRDDLDGAREAGLQSLLLNRNDESADLVSLAELPGLVVLPECPHPG